MKLNVKGCREFIRERNIKDYAELAKEFESEVVALKRLEEGAPVGYDFVRDLYNKFGEDAVRRLIDFGEETIDGFKSKYVLIGNRLY